MTFSGGPLTTETLDEGHDERRQTGWPRWGLVGVLLIAVAAALAAALFLSRDDGRDQPEPVTGADAYISAVRAQELRSDHQDTIVTLRFEGLPGGWRMVDIVGLPDGIGYVGRESRLVPDDGDLDVSFRWEDVSCAMSPPGYVALEVQLARPDQALASSTLLVDAADAFDRAWERACFRIG